MQRTDSGLGLVSSYGAEEEEDEAAKDDRDGVDTISGSDDEGGHEHKKKKDRTRSHSGEEKRAKTDSPVNVVSPKRPKMRKTITKLVSYGADELDSDDELDQSGENIVLDESKEDIVLNIKQEDIVPHTTYVDSSGFDIKLPPEAPGKCSKELQAKISRLHHKVTVEGYDLNASIQKRKDFRNPSIYEKLLQYCEIDDKGTNYPPHLFDPKIWGPESFYDELAKAQKIEMDKREKERKERTKVEFVSGTKKIAMSLADASGEPKRKSKWDAQPCVPGAVIQPPPSSVTSAASGTKSTVISAVGSITKKK